MIRSILAVIIGFVLWSALWLGYNALLTTSALLPADSTHPVQTPTPLLLLLVGSVVCSLLAGYATTALARRPGRIHAVVLEDHTASRDSASRAFKSTTATVTRLIRSE